MWPAFALAGLAGLAWGASDFIGGVLSRGRSVRTVLLWSKCAGLLLAVAVVAVRDEPLPRNGRLVLAVVAGLLGLPAMALLYLAIRRGSMIVTAPVAAVGAAIPVMWAVTRGEPVGVLAALGILAALAGVTLISWPVGPSGARPPTTGDVSRRWFGRRPIGRRRVGPLGRLVRLAHRSGMTYAMGAAAGFGAYFVLLHEASAVDPYWSTAAARIAGGTVALGWVFARRPRLGPVGPGRWRLLLVAAALTSVGLLDALADGSFAFASTVGPLGTASMISSMYPAVTVLLGLGLLRESLHRLHLWGVLAALVGVASLAASVQV